MNEQTRSTAWQTMLRISLILVPLSLILTMAGAMKEGVSSVISYANAREAITEWVVSVALMASSYFVINLALHGSEYISTAIRDMMLQQPDLVNLGTIGNAFASSFVVNLVIYNISPIVSLFLFFFNIFGVVALVGSIVLSSLAQQVGIIVATALAPLVYILSALRPLSWLKGMWLKMIVVLVLLPPVNTLLLTIGATLLIRSYAGTGSSFGNSFLGILTMVGVVSVIITVNAAIGKLVYGAAMDIAQKAWGATKAVIAAVASVAAFAAAPAVLGAMSGAGAASAGAGTATAGAGAATSLAGAGAGAGTGAATPSLGTGMGQTASAMKSNPLATFGKNADVSQLSSQLGNVLSHSGNPILRGMGNGMNARGLVDSASSMRQSNQQRNDTIARQPSQMESGFATGQKAIEANWSNKLRPASSGVEKAQAVFKAAELNGLSRPEFLQQTGWLDAAGGNLELAMSNATQYYGLAHGSSVDIANSSNVFRGFSAPAQAENSGLHQAALLTSHHNNAYAHSNDPSMLARDAQAFELAASRPGSSMGKTVEFARAEAIKGRSNFEKFIDTQIGKTAGHS
ncbi:MAG: hypothetical protein ACYDH2_03455 [Anaerolineaceae bacterium]